MTTNKKSVSPTIGESAPFPLTANTREQAAYMTTMSVVKTVKGRKALLTALEQVGRRGWPRGRKDNLCRCKVVEFTIYVTARATHTD